MKPKTYNPKILLTSLLEIEGLLVRMLEMHCPDQKIYISEDIDKAMEDFLKLRDVKDEVDDYLPSQLALLILCREMEKTIQIVVESNNLKAYYDYGKFLERAKGVKLEKKSKARIWIVLFLILLGCLFGGTGVFLFFVT